MLAADGFRFFQSDQRVAHAGIALLLCSAAAALISTRAGAKT
jgi:hypothetical protein